MAILIFEAIAFFVFFEKEATFGQQGNKLKAMEGSEERQERLKKVSATSIFIT